MTNSNLQNSHQLRSARTWMYSVCDHSHWQHITHFCLFRILKVLCTLPQSQSQRRHVSARSINVTQGSVLRTTYLYPGGQVSVHCASGSGLHAAALHRMPALHRQHHLVIISTFFDQLARYEPVLSAIPTKNNQGFRPPR